MSASSYNLTSPCIELLLLVNAPWDLKKAFPQIEIEYLPRILEANFKWRQSLMMVDYAFKQLNEAVLKWESLATIDQESLEERSKHRKYNS
jgi:hypothetical protein